MNGFLLAGGIASLLVAALHVAIVLGGASWYRFFGAGDAMAHRAAAGSVMPGIVTTAIAAVFFVWGLYALSGAGAIRPVPLLHPVLIAVAAIYLLRGALLIPTLFGMTPVPDLPSIKPNDAFTVWTSAISFAIGLCYAIGWWQIRNG